MIEALITAFALWCVTGLIVADAVWRAPVMEDLD